MICKRCNAKTNVWRYSWFNLDKLCNECCELERKHPDYEKALQAERSEVMAGNYNFEGIGLPENYEEWVKQYKQDNAK